jgi:hypothetical protein
VTGAALSSSVDSTADFRIVATNELTVGRNEDLDGNQSSYNNFSDVGPADFNYSVAGETGPSSQTTGYPNMTINSTNNGDLGMALATDNDETTAYNQNASRGGREPYNGTNHTPAADAPVAPLQITNTGGTAQTIGAEYELGGAADNSASADTLDWKDVVRLFTWEIDGTQISPEPNTTDSTYNSGTDAEVVNDKSAGNLPEVQPGNTVEVDLVINHSDRIEGLISDAAGSGGSYTFGSTSTDDVNLLDVVRFGQP